MRQETKKLVVALVAVCMFLLLFSGESSAQNKEFKLGVLYSMTGAFAPAGALGGYRGTMVAVDMINAKGGIAGEYKVVPVVADAQSNPDIAIREGQRLMTGENVPVIIGVFSSAIAVPLAPMAEKNEKIFWVTIAISDKVLEDRHQKNVFRVQPMGSQWGKTSVEMIKANHAKFGCADPKQIRVAVIHEDGPYGVSTSSSSLALLKEYGMNVVLTEAYSVQAKDLSSLILKLKAAKPDVILHTGYFPDIVLFFRQAREMGLKTQAIVGHGAGHSNFAPLQEALGRELINYVFDLDPAPAQILDPKKLAAGQGELIKEFLKRYKEKFGVDDPPSHATQGFGHAWVLLNDVCPAALKKYGNLEPESIRKAAAEIDIPEGATPCGYGVKFAPPEDKYGGQNVRSYPVVMQWVNGKLGIVWPASLQTADPIIPIPADSPYGVK
ncbi:MAG: ABC transporter substrate-binding protein [Desulfomonilaceae bacterium]